VFGDFFYVDLKSMSNIENIPVDFIIKRGLWDSRPRKLIFLKDLITFDDKSSDGDTLASIKKEDIKDFRYGIIWLNGFRFIIGREYQIYIRSHTNQIIKLNFSTFYGINKKNLHEKYRGIVDTLWDLYFSDVVRKLLLDFYSGKTINVCDVLISSDSVIIQSKGLFKTVKHDISWNQLQTRAYATYFAIYSSENPADINKSYKYLDDWNTAVLYSVIRTIVRERTKDINI
jgi:hypothetical protein